MVVSKLGWVVNFGIERLDQFEEVGRRLETPFAVF